MMFKKILVFPLIFWTLLTYSHAGYFYQHQSFMKNLFNSIIKVPVVEVILSNNGSVINRISEASAGTIVSITISWKTRNILVLKPEHYSLQPSYEGDWRSSVDSNCTNEDITFTYSGQEYTRAGCNSILWGTDYDWSIQDCNGWGVANDSLYFSATKREIDINNEWWSYCKIDNIFGKFYQRDSADGGGGWSWLYYNCSWTADNNFVWTNNDNCPCPDGRHVPTYVEWIAAEDYFTWEDWWWGSLEWLTIQLWLPLAGFWDPNMSSRGDYGVYWSANETDGTRARSHASEWSNDFISNNFFDPKSRFNSVRCLKDY